MRALLVSPLGFLIGVSLGALGGGGSILAVPVLVYAAGQTPKQATASSLILVSLTALVGIVPHWRAGRVRVVPGLLFSLAGVGASLVASHWNSLVDDDVLLLAFAMLMLVVAGLMMRSQRRRRRAAPEPAADRVRTEPVRLDVSTVAKVIGAGSVVGFLTGFFGVGGGFVIVPALVLALGFSMPDAVGTSLLVIVVNSMVALSTRLDGGNVDWSVIVPFAVSSLAGVLVGGRLAGRHDPSKLQRWFVGLLVAVAVYTAVRSGLALADG